MIVRRMRPFDPRGNWQRVFRPVFEGMGIALPVWFIWHWTP
jgi:hypothetical protein